jgi:hypothetical protein
VVHAAADHAWVHGYLLPALGLPEGAVRTPDDLTLGAPRVAEIERAVADARVVVLVLSPAFLDDVWSELAELLTSHARVLGGQGRLVPLVREPCELPLRVEFLFSLDCTRQELWAGAVARLRQHLERAGSHRSRSASPAPTRGSSPTARPRPRSSSAARARSTTWPGGSPARAW